jgi:hypothetical protein
MYKRIALAFGLFLASPLVADDSVQDWYRYPRPAGTPHTSRPPDREFLKILPPPRPAPQLTAEQKKLGMAIWWGDGSQMMDCLQPPSAEDLKHRPIVRTVAGEDEPLVLGLWGVRDGGQVTLSVKESPFTVTLRHVEFAPRYVPGAYYEHAIEGGRWVGFANYLPKQATGQIDSGRNTVFWINVQTPKDVQPGSYQFELSLIVHGIQVVDLPVTVHVADYQLPRADIAYGMYFRQHVLPPRYRTPEMLHAYWRDMARHGMTSTTLYAYERVHDEAGQLLDFGSVPALNRLNDMVGDGLVTTAVPVMLLNGSLVDPFRADHADIIARFKTEAKNHDWPPFLWYGPDEPAVSDESLAELQGLQPTRENYPIVTAISDEAAEAYASLLDVWVLQAGTLTPKIRQLAAESGAELWNYTCTNRGAGNAPFNRFYAGVYTWAFNLKGNFIWCYTENYAWEGDRCAIFCWVLPSDSGPVPSIAWEARREGVEDYRTLRLLESHIAAQPANPVAVEAKAWLQSVRDKVDWYLARDIPPSLYPWDAPELCTLCPNFQPGELSQMRRKAADYLAKIR